MCYCLSLRWHIPQRIVPGACRVGMKDYVPRSGSKWGEFYLRGETLVDLQASISRIKSPWENRARSLRICYVSASMLSAWLQGHEAEPWMSLVSI